MSNILITGGTGSWGNELVKQLLEKSLAEKIVIYSRNEFNQVTMQRKFNDSRLQFVIGDVRDYNSLLIAMKNIDIVFHLAALKHVPICEFQPLEAVKINILGTQNIIAAAIANNVKKVIDVSTDKAVAPVNLYGMTKAIGEKLIIQANMISDTKFICIRGGNAIGSNGSAIPLFKQQILQTNSISLTDKNMTRFFLSLPAAIDLLFKATEVGIGGETFVMHMPSYTLQTIAEAMIQLYGNDQTKITEIGIRPGEKLHEVLISKDESFLSYSYDKNYYLILPSINPRNIIEHYRLLGLEKIAMEEYSSQSFIFDKLNFILQLQQV